ncbi:MAG: Crp/Fnr family transcriptional regulator [Chloroflexi bacterium]|nr:MAG: Crp/Fnr family transcriptional regulator [Chloroflexota bacterium]
MSTDNVAAVVQSLADLPLLARLPEPALLHLARASYARRYPRGQVLCSEGDPGDSLLLLEHGQVVVSRVSLRGQEIVLATLDAPASFGELSLIDGQPRSATVTAQQPVVVRIVPRQVVLDLLDREPALARSLLLALTAMVRGGNERLSDLLTLDIPGRLAKWLLARAERAGTPEPAGVRIVLGRSQGELAAELGATRVSVNKALATFQSLGLLELDGGSVLLLRPDDLADYAS